MKTEKKMFTFAGRGQKRLPRGEELELNLSIDEVTYIPWMKEITNTTFPEEKKTMQSWEMQVLQLKLPQ